MTHDELYKSHPILIVEDSMPDYEALIRIIKKRNMTNPIFHCKTGQEALDFLYHKGIYADNFNTQRPAIILLDLNLPGTDGREVLKRVKGDEDLKSIPVIVFTTSDSEKDIEESYENGANTYIVKPVNLDELYDVIDTLKEYWFDTASMTDTGY